MSVDMYDSRTMLAAMEEMFPPRTFLRDTFFRNTRTFTSKTVDVDVKKGGRRVAIYVDPKDKGHVNDRKGYTTKSYEAPYIKEQKVITPYDLLSRSPGQSIYDPQGPQARAAKALADDLTELDEMVTRAEEIQACQGMFAGAITVRNGDTISFGLAAAHNLASNAGHTLWASIAKTALLAQLRGWRRLLVKDSGRSPTDIILGSDAADAFLKALDPDSGGGLTNLRVERGQITPSLLPNGVTYLGYFPELGVDVWSYDEYYHNGSTDVAMVPEKKMWMGSRNARFDRLYGVIQDMEALYAVSRFPRSWLEKDPSARMVEVQSAPLLVPHEVDSFMVAAVIS
jgi:hypothetical protein